MLLDYYCIILIIHFINFLLSVTDTKVTKHGTKLSNHAKNTVEEKSCGNSATQLSIVSFPVCFVLNVSFDQKPIRKGAVGSTLMVEDLGRRKINNKVIPCQVRSYLNLCLYQIHNFSFQIW